VRLRIGDDVRHQTHTHTQPVSSLLLASIPSSFFFYDVASAAVLYSGGSFSSLTFSCSRPIVRAALDPPPHAVNANPHTSMRHTHSTQSQKKKKKKKKKKGRKTF
jgi:hypothetical protein